MPENTTPDDSAPAAEFVKIPRELITLSGNERFAVAEIYARAILHRWQPFEFTDWAMRPHVHQCGVAFVVGVMEQRGYLEVVRAPSKGVRRIIRVVDLRETN